MAFQKYMGGIVLKLYSFFLQQSFYPAQIELIQFEIVISRFYVQFCVQQDANGENRLLDCSDMAFLKYMGGIVLKLYSFFLQQSFYPAQIELIQFEIVISRFYVQFCVQQDANGENRLNA